MRLRERKQVNYHTSDTEDSGDGNLPATATKFSQDSVGESSYSDDSDEDRFVEESCEQEDNRGADKLGDDSRRSLRNGNRNSMFAEVHTTADPKSNFEDENHRDGDDFKSSKFTLPDQDLSFISALKPRSTRSVRVNYNEGSCSEGSGREEERRPVENHSLSFVKPGSPRLIHQGDRGSNNDLNAVTSSDHATEDDFAFEKVSRENAEIKSRRRLVKLADRRKICETKDFEDSPCSKRSGIESEDAECLVAAQTSNGEDLNTVVSGNELLAGQTEVVSKCISEFMTKKADNWSALQVPSFTASKDTTCFATEIEFLAHTYVRRRRNTKHQSSDNAEDIGNLKAPALPKRAQNEEHSLPEIKVDVFGPYRGKNEDRPVVKRAGQVEKFLSIRNRNSDTPVYCVKLIGKSYRNVVYVSESFALKNYPQLLRNFLRRIDDLHRVDGNLGEKADSPAFDPLYLQVDRIVAAEQRGRKKCYLVKWRGLPYSESTWESEDSMLGEKEEMKQFLRINTKGAPTSSTTTFRDGRVLRDYQKKGLAWMDHNFKKHTNCILADEMGLGKTMQSVAMLQNLRVKWKIKGPFLVVAPVSTLGHWQREIESLTDMNCVVYSGSMEDRNIIKEYEFYCSSRKSWDLKFNVLLTGYEVLMKDHFFLSKHEWQYIIVDEAHRLKTKHSKTARTFKELSVRTGGLLLLTGTPVQNNTKEIFSLLNLLDPDQFHSEEDFLSKYGDIQNIEQVRDLQENILKPRLLRRMKEDVEKSIPLKEETIIWVELTQDQRSYYKAIYENRISDLLRGSQSSNIPNLRNVAMELRKLCNHPFLCDGLEEHLNSKYKHGGLQDAQVEESLEVSRKVLCQSSGKMLLLDKLLPMLKDAGRRVLIFSQFTILLDILEDYMHLKGYSYERIDGKIRGSERQAAIDRYSASGSDTFVFLLSTRAGGLGITLTAADTCIIYDSDWNPQNDLQAMARCHRIGQTKDVKIYRLITRNTYEQHLFECSSRKYGLDEAILGNILGSNGDIEHSKNIESLLRRGAYNMLKDDGEAEAAAFHSQNIDQILEQRTQKRLIGGRGNNTFSVATFISNPEIQSDDGDDKEKNLYENVESAQFWQELLPEVCHAAQNAEKPQEISSAGPRRRAQVNYKEKGEISDEGSSDEEKKSDVRRCYSGNKRNREAEEYGVNQWSEKELKRFEARFIMLGKGREEQVMNEAGLEHRGLSEVQQLADTLIKFCLYFQERERIAAPGKDMTSKTKDETECNLPPEGKTQCISGLNPDIKDMDVGIGTVNKYLCQDRGDVKVLGDRPSVQDSPISNEQENTMSRNIECPRIPPFAQNALASQSSMIRIQKNASRNLQILNERDVLAKALSDSNFFPVSIPRSKKLPPWWSEAEDLDLMRGALKHGHKDFQKIREDPSLCFAARLNTKKHGLCNETPLEAQNSNFTAESLKNVEAQDQVEEDEWPHDSVLGMRVRKLIECLPNGLSDREIKRRAAVSEASRKRFQDLRMTKEVAPLSSQDSQMIQMGYVINIDGYQYEQSELHAKVDIGGNDSRINSVAVPMEPADHEILTLPIDSRMLTSSTANCNISVVQNNCSQRLRPDTVPFYKPPGSIFAESEVNFSNVLDLSMLISNQLLNGQSSAVTCGRQSNSPFVNTNQTFTSMDALGSPLQHKFASYGRVYEGSLLSDLDLKIHTPAGFSGIRSMQWMPSGATACGVPVGLNEAEIQDYNFSKRRTGYLAPNVSKRQKECALDTSSQVIAPGTLKDFSTPHPDI